MSENKTIIKIAKRAKEEINNNIDVFDTFMNLSEVNKQKPLNLKAMLEAPLDQLAHDIYGIDQHLNKKTGKLENCFLPRYAK